MWSHYDIIEVRSYIRKITVKCKKVKIFSLVFIGVIKFIFYDAKYTNKVI